MAITVAGTQITFNDSTVQTTASGLIAGTSYVPVNGNTALLFDNIPSSANEIVFVWKSSYTSGPSGSSINARDTNNTVLSSFSGVRTYFSTGVTTSSISNSSDIISGGQSYWMSNFGHARILKLPSYSGVHLYSIVTTSGAYSSYQIVCSGTITSSTPIKSLVWNPGTYQSGGAAQIFWNKG